MHSQLCRSGLNGFPDRACTQCGRILSETLVEPASTEFWRCCTCALHCDIADDVHYRYGVQQERVGRDTRSCDRQLLGMRRLHARLRHRHTHVQRHMAGWKDRHARVCHIITPRAVSTRTREGATCARADSSRAREKRGRRNALMQKGEMTSLHARVQGRTAGVRSRTPAVQARTTCLRCRRGSRAGSSRGRVRSYRHAGRSSQAVGDSSFTSTTRSPPES